MDIRAGGEHMSAYGSSGYTVASAYNYMHGLLKTRCQQCVFVCVCVCVCVSVCVCGREGRWFETLVNADKTLNKRDESGIIPLGFLRHADTRVCTT
jgi:hypothetical protein